MSALDPSSGAESHKRPQEGHIWPSLCGRTVHCTEQWHYSSGNYLQFEARAGPWQTIPKLVDALKHNRGTLPVEN